MAEQLAFPLAVIDPEEFQEVARASRAAAGKKTRKCLSCDALFQSEGAGNRVCPHCKTLDAWQTGAFDHSLSGISF